MSGLITDEAYQLGLDGVLHNPSDDDICLAAAEMALGRWPSEGLDRHLCDRVVKAYDRGADRRAGYKGEGQ